MSSIWRVGVGIAGKYFPRVGDRMAGFPPKTACSWKHDPITQKLGKPHTPVYEITQQLTYCQECGFILTTLENDYDGVVCFLAADLAPKECKNA